LLECFLFWGGGGGGRDIVHLNKKEKKLMSTSHICQRHKQEGSGKVAKPAPCSIRLAAWAERCNSPLKSCDFISFFTSKHRCPILFIHVCVYISINIYPDILKDSVARF